MSIKIVKDKWYDENNNVITGEKKAKLRQEIHEELDKELDDHGFGGLIKRFVKKQIDR